VHTEFTTFSKAEAHQWLTTCGHGADQSDARTLAELYAVLDGSAAARPSRRRVGFSV
jgi:hypothetical protein